MSKLCSDVGQSKLSIKYKNELFYIYITDIFHC